MKSRKYKTITVTLGLISLMMFCVLGIVSITGLFKGNAAYARVMGILIITAGASLSLNAATTILDRPKEQVSKLYRTLALSIVVGTLILVIFWLIVVFVSDIGLIVKYIVGGKFKVSEYGTIELAKEAGMKVQNTVEKHLVITQIAICLTIIVAYLNLVVTRRFVFKNRMIPIQITLYIGAFLFYFWIFWFALSAKAELTFHEKKNLYSLDIRSTVGAVVNPLGFTIALSGLAMYIISRFASIGSMRRFKNEGLFEETKKEILDDLKGDEPKVEEPKQVETATTNDSNDVKARLEKLKELHAQGLITDEEFEKKKKDIIDSL